MPTNKTIREEFEERFVNRNGNFNAKSSMEAVYSFLHSALLTQIQEIEDMIGRMKNRTWDIDAELKEGFDLAIDLLSIALKEKKEGLKENY